ncbi:hypothetical protein, conserved [Eimeria tenella]|uniref:Uncharacterized protein n=1 Tax=Eimeria tenella TaxID=5802 RepID=U6KS46_EIMTE|nr:hypothetical protein, conserved [Eimeria tenella]CDJ39753.1 hypothetical protein, conserved [Eimeria tenella]|eukprot:XP_013230506.1 hypothetical protein, conserved [Eimeria tenella]
MADGEGNSQSSAAAAAAVTETAAAPSDAATSLGRAQAAARANIAAAAKPKFGAPPDAHQQSCSSIVEDNCETREVHRHEQQQQEEQQTQEQQQSEEQQERPREQQQQQQQQHGKLKQSKKGGGSDRELLNLITGHGNSLSELCLAFTAGRNKRSRAAAAPESPAAAAAASTTPASKGSSSCSRRKKLVDSASAKSAADKMGKAAAAAAAATTADPAAASASSTEAAPAAAAEDEEGEGLLLAVCSRELRNLATSAELLQAFSGCRSSRRAACSSISRDSSANKASSSKGRSTKGSSSKSISNNRSSSSSSSSSKSSSSKSSSNNRSSSSSSKSSSSKSSSSSSSKGSSSKNNNRSSSGSSSKGNSTSSSSSKQTTKKSPPTTEKGKTTTPHKGWQQQQEQQQKSLQPSKVSGQEQQQQQQQQQQKKEKQQLEEHNRLKSERQQQQPRQQQKQKKERQQLDEQQHKELKPGQYHHRKQQKERSGSQLQQQQQQQQKSEQKHDETARSKRGRPQQEQQEGALHKKQQPRIEKQQHGDAGEKKQKRQKQEQQHGQSEQHQHQQQKQQTVKREEQQSDLSPRRGSSDGGASATQQGAAAASAAAASVAAEAAAATAAASVAAPETPQVAAISAAAAEAATKTAAAAAVSAALADAAAAEGSTASTSELSRSSKEDRHGQTSGKNSSSSCSSSGCSSGVAVTSTGDDRSAADTSSTKTEDGESQTSFFSSSSSKSTSKCSNSSSSSSSSISNDEEQETACALPSKLEATEEAKMPATATAAEATAADLAELPEPKQDESRKMQQQQQQQQHQPQHQNAVLAVPSRPAAKARRRPVKPGAASNFCFCSICGSPGELLCCDFCPRVMHAACLYSYKPLRRFLPEGSRSAAAASFYNSSCLSAAAAAELQQLPPAPRPREGLKPHSEATAKRQPCRAAAARTAAAAAAAENEGYEHWMCPVCHGEPVAVAAEAAGSHPAWRRRRVDFAQLAEEGGLVAVFKELQELRRFFAGELAWRKWKAKNGERVQAKSQRIQQQQQQQRGKQQQQLQTRKLRGGPATPKQRSSPSTEVTTTPPSESAATAALETEAAAVSDGVYVLLSDLPGEVARELLQSMAKVASLHAIKFLRDFILQLGESPNDDDRQHFLEYGPEVAYLLANLLGYMGPSGLLQQPTLNAAAAILNVWSRRRSRITADGLLHDSKVFALLEASWAQLMVHRHSSLSGSSPLLQRVEYVQWLEEVREAVRCGGLESLGFDYQGGRLLLYDLTACPNCNDTQGIQGPFTACMACGCQLLPEVCCVDFGRLFEQLVWGSLLHRAGIEALAGSGKSSSSNSNSSSSGSSSSSSTSLVAAILKEMSRSIRPWRNRSDLGTEDWRNQVYMVTHALLVVSGWGRFSLNLGQRFWLPDCRFLRFALHEAIAVEDVEMTGEILHALRLFVIPQRASAGAAAAAGGAAADAALAEEVQSELRAEAFAIRLAVQHGLVFLLSKQQRGSRGRWTPKDETQYKTFHASYCAAMGLIRPHRGNFGAGEADRQHAEWQDLFVSAIPKVPMSDPSCCCKLAAAAAAHSSAARAAARASLDAAEPRVSPYLSCAVSALIIPPAEDEAASLLARVKVTIRALHRPVSCRVWRKLACSSKAKRLKLFKEREFLQQDPVGSQDVYVGIYKFREQCFVCLQDVAVLLQCTEVYLQHRVCGWLRPPVAARGPIRMAFRAKKSETETLLLYCLTDLQQLQFLHATAAVPEMLLLPFSNLASFAAAVDRQVFGKAAP